MPMGYDVSAIGQTATTTVSLAASLLTTSTTAKPSAYITGVWANVGGNAMTTAGGGYMLANIWQTVGVQTTTTTPQKKNQYQAAANTGAVNATANGAVGTGTQTSRITVGYSQVGGPGFWIATTPDMALMANAGGSTTGYVDFTTRTASASMLLNFTVEFYEA